MEILIDESRESAGSIGSGVKWALEQPQSCSI